MSIAVFKLGATACQTNLYKLTVGGVSILIKETINELRSLANPLCYTVSYKCGGDAINKVQCIDFVVQFSGTVENIVTEAILNNLVYDEGCSLGALLERGEKFQNLLKGFMGFIKQRHPQIENVILSDCSTIECVMGANKNQKKKTSLKHFSIAFNGQTYYEKHFGARLITNHDKYVAGVAKLSVATEKMPYEYFKNTFLKVDYLAKDAKIKEHYESSQTYREFFDKFADTAERCYLLAPFIEQFITFILSKTLNLTMWHIPIDDQINNIAYTIEPITQTSVRIIGGTKRLNMGKRKIQHLRKTKRMKWRMRY